jgi:hypothetical protein
MDNGTPGELTIEEPPACTFLSGDIAWGSYPSAAHESEVETDHPSSALEPIHEKSEEVSLDTFYDIHIFTRFPCIFSLVP